MHFQLHYTSLINSICLIVVNIMSCRIFRNETVNHSCVDYNYYLGVVTIKLFHEREVLSEQC